MSLHNALILSLVRSALSHGESAAADAAARDAAHANQVATEASAASAWRADPAAPCIAPLALPDDDKARVRRIVFRVRALLLNLISLMEGTDRGCDV